ncbi:MAG TPA: hypothetical protein VKY73_07010 [Polyangiaceae bacterium]|nr:hypothetical protein [Polyangiaceae bacterium]
MPRLVFDAVELALLIAGYWAVDRALRRQGLLRALRRLGLESPVLQTALVALPCIAVAPSFGFDDVPQEAALRLLAFALVVPLTWKATTRDIDVVLGDRQLGLRLVLLASTAALWVSPAFLVLAGFLLSGPFGLWEHHSTLPMRLTQALVAFIGLALVPWGAPLFRDAAVEIFFVLVILVSHYFITALAKARLGPKWFSWVTDNRLHHLAASAYSWGFARFLPWNAWRRVIAAVRTGERPVQAATFAIELLSPLALLHPSIAIALCIAWSAFHLGVFAVSGLLFWDWVLTDLAVAATLVVLPGAVAERAFGGLALVAGLVVLALFPLRHRLWKPLPLGWFDTPFTQRIHWRVRGESGAWYGLYNDFMDPHERLYGKVHGCFAVPVAVFTYHLGEVWKPELRDAIRAAGPCPARLDEVRRRFGILPRNERMLERHVAYLRRFFAELARGAKKHVLPRWLRWLKAPGDQIYYWGELPAYRGQERAVEVKLLYREEYFEGSELRRLRDEEVCSIELASSEVPEPVRELTPKELDDYLLALARGRLIDLPRFGGGYVEGDDGRVEHAAPSR